MNIQHQLIDIATRNVTCLQADATIGEAAHIMAQRRFSSIVITDKSSHPVGIVTERNILHAMRAATPSETPLRTCMSAPVVVMSGTTNCLDAYQTCMREGIRHLVLVDDEGAVAGVVSETDFRLHLNLTALAGHRQVISVAERSVTSLSLLSSLMQALNLMQSQRASCVVVVEDEKPVGIVTERDVVRFYSRQPERVTIPLAEVMTSPVLTICGEATINEAAEQMLEKKVRHLAVVDGSGRMIGLVSEHDLTQTMAMGLMDEKFEVDELFLRTFINTIPDLVWLKDAKGVFLACNSRFELLVGTKEAEIVGKTDYDFVNKEQADFFRKQDFKAMLSGKPSVNEEWLSFASDGYRGLFETIKTPMHDSQGQLVGVLGVARDITERKRAEDALRESEKKLRSLYQLSPLGIALTGMNGRYVEFNESFRRICGYTCEELKALDYWALTPKKYEADEARQLESLTGTGRYGPYEKEYVRKDGSLVPLRLNGVLVTGRDGEKYIWSIVEDISEHKQAELQLKESELRYRTLADSGQALIWTSGTDKLCDYFNKVWLEFTGRSMTQEMGNGWAAGVHPDDLQRCQDVYVSSFDRRDKFGMDYRLRRHDGEYRWIWDEGCPRYNSEGEFIGYIGYCLDITERKQAEGSLRITASVFDNSQEAILITSADNVIIDVNPAFTHITGYKRDEVLGRNPKFLSSGRQDKAFYAEMWASLREERAWRGEIWNRRKNGETYAELLSISVICDDAGKVQRHVAVFSDITYFKEHEAELSHVANYDALTGIPNRRLLADRLGQAIAHAQRNGKMLAICYIDLDGFKDINDRYGHEAGDLLLVNVTHRLQEVLRAGDTLARLGGDEFVVLFNDLSQEIECFQVLDRIVQTIAKPTQLLGHQVAISASVGVTFYPADDEDGDTLLRHADQAMYIAKQTGKSRYHLYDALHDQRIRSLHESRRRILQGLEAGEFELYYQPKLELATNKIVGVEALVRWHHPDQGLLHPPAFLPVIENSELDIKLGNWVMDTALEQLRVWNQDGVALEVSINISARHLQSPNFVAELQFKLEQLPKFPHGRLQIEVLETAALEDMVQSSEVIETCRKLGVSFALDDFGTGYSSLMYLSKLAADTLKIDQSFVKDMAFNEGDCAIVKGVIALAKTFHRQTVAEGIEDPQLVQMLAEMGCGYGQGYGIAYPMPAAEFLDWYRKR